MRTYTTTVSPSRAIKNGVLAVTGYGVRITVDRKHLSVADGICDERRNLKLSRATCGLKRLVVLGHTGFITLEALRWLQDIGAALSVIDANAQVLLSSGRKGHSDARLRRAQALAASNGVGLEIARDLLREKLRGQATVLRRVNGADPTLERLARGLETLQNAKTLDRLRIIEAEAGAVYWRACEGLPIRFAHRDETRVPQHWRVFGVRHSPLTASPRNAINPANALLNYLYAVLECEARIAAVTVGLDPSIGLLHADLPYRDSLACDLVEPVRPRVDAFVLEMLHTRTFQADNFVETRQGVCRVSPELATLLAGTAPAWAQAVAPIAERVAHELRNGHRKREPRPQPTPLTQLNRSVGRDRSRRRPGRVVPPHLAALPQACRNCGVILDGHRRQYCDQCLPQRQKEMVAAWAETGLKTLAQRRALGWDPAHGGHAGYQRGRKNAHHRRATAVWEQRQEGQRDVREFQEEILPRLQSVPLREIARATGFSLAYCSFVRRGLRVPHPRHWETLRRRLLKDYVGS